VSDAVLFGESAGPAQLEGYGPIPAGVARTLLASSLTAKCKTWLRRLYQQPGTGRLVAMDSRSRLVPAALGEFVGIRDQVCRTPWCDAPIRHRDHVIPVTEGGETSGVNSQGLCERCNHAKQARGWSARPRPGPRHSVETRTPTGHAYWSTAPPPSPTDQPASRIEGWFAQLVLAS
jgi:5-methylcytosine-specific restriction endonuclease McrA